MGYLNGFLAQRVENLNTNVSKNTNARGLTGKGKVKFQFEVFLT